METLPPNMSRKAEFSVIGHGENAQYPSHDRGKAFAFTGFEKEMDMVAHYAEIPNAKTVFSPCSDHHGLEKVPDRFLV